MSTQQSSVVFVMHRGNDKTYQVVVTDKDTGLPVNLEGSALTMTWKEKYTSTTNFLQKTFVLTDPVNGKAEVDIDSEDTEDLSPDKKHEYVFDVEILKPSGKKETLIVGKFEIRQKVTTPPAP